jgi:hypothetical protein
MHNFQVYSCWFFEKLYDYLDVLSLTNSRFAQAMCTTGGTAPEICSICQPQRVWTSSTLYAYLRTIRHVCLLVCLLFVFIIVTLILSYLLCCFVSRLLDTDSPLHSLHRFSSRSPSWRISNVLHEAKVIAHIVLFVMCFQCYLMIMCWYNVLCAHNLDNLTAISLSRFSPNWTSVGVFKLGSQTSQWHHIVGSVLLRRQRYAPSL